MNFLIENAKIRNKHTILKINHICLPEKYDLDMWTNIIEDECTFIIKDLNNSDKIVGYCAVTDRYTKKPCLVSFAILPEYRNKGLGKKLILKTIESTKKKWNNCNLILHVSVNNDIALKLYENIGFTIKDKIKNYYEYSDGYEMIMNI